MADEGAAITRRWGKWSQAGVPHLGWQCVSEYDAIEEDGDLITCEMCETTQVRFVHVMEHPDYFEQLQCGCVCSAHMSGDRKRADEREKRMRSRAGRREHFAKRKAWKVARDTGNAYIATGGFHIVIASKQDGRFQIGGKSTMDPRHAWGRKRYQTLEQAKTGAFDALEFLKEERKKRWGY